MRRCFCWVAWVPRGGLSCSFEARGAAAKCPPLSSCVEASDRSRTRTKFCCLQRLFLPVLALIPCLCWRRVDHLVIWHKPSADMTAHYPIGPLQARLASVSWSCLVLEASQNRVLLVPGSHRCFIPGSEIENLLLPVKSRGCAEFLCLCPSEGAATGSDGCTPLMWWLRLCLRTEAAGFRPTPCRIMNCHASADYLTSLYNV